MATDDTSALLSTATLARWLTERPNLRILDVRWRLNSPSRKPEYDEAHVPGASWCDLETDLADPPGARGRHPLPDVARLQERFIEWGIDPESTVVVYDLDDSVAAARAWWVLRWAGVDDVRVLDGGWAAWVAAGGPVTADLPEVSAGRVVVKPGSMPTLTAEEAARTAASGVLIDVRAPERFRGETEPIDPVAGRIPGARNLPTSGNVRPDGFFLDGAQLAHRFASMGVSGAEPAVGVYCGSGVTATHTVLALHEIGVTAALYAGSWSEWITDPARPVATGE